MKSEQHNQPTDNEVIKNLENIILQLTVELNNKNDKLKKLEVALSESDEKFINLFDRSIVGKSITTLDGKIHVNKAFSEILGYSENELKDLNWTEITHPDDIELNKQIMQRILSGENKSVRWEKRYIHKKGHIIWTNICTTLQRDKAGNPQYFITAIIDITSQKKIETELKNSREQFEDLFENAPIGYHEIDFEGKVLLMNKTELDLLGYTIDEVKGRYIWEFIQNPTFSKATTSSKLAGTEILVLPYEREFLSKDGRLIPILLQDKVLRNDAGKITGIRSTVQDITELKKTEKALKISETRNSSIIETAMEGFWRVDKTGKILQVNNSLCQMTGYTTSELLTMSVSDIEDTENQEDVEKHIKFVQENNFHRFETKHRRKDGQIIDLEVSLQLVNENEGQVVAFFRDITERKKAEYALRESEEKFRKIFHTSPESMTITTIENGLYKDVNKGFTQITGYDFDEVIGKKSKDIDIWNDIADRNFIVETLKAKGIVENYVCRFKTKNSEIIYGIVSAVIIELEGENHILMITRDITELKNIENTLKESELFFRESQMVGGIGSYKLNFQTGLWNSSEVLDNIFGIDSNYKKDVSGWLNIVYEEDVDMMNQYFGIEVMGKLQPFDKEYRIKRINDGSIRWLHGLGKLITNENNQLLTMQGTIQDITERKLAEQALRENEELLSLYIKNSPIYSFIKEVSETESKVLYASENFIDMIGIQGHDMIGKNMFELFPTEFAKHITEDDWMVHQTNEVLKLDENLNDRNYITIKFPIVQGDRNLLAGFTIDITDRKKAENELRESQEKLSALFEGMTEMTVIHELIFDKNNQPVNYIIIDCNHAFTKITGITRQIAIGNLATKVYETETAPYIDVYASVCKSGQSMEYKTYFQPMDKHFMISVVALSDTRFATITADITDIQKSKETISEKNKELENYLYVASHDLRSPLVNIQVFSQRLNKQITQITDIVSELKTNSEKLSEMNKITTDEIPKSLNFILNNVSKMDILINGLLQVSRTGRVVMNIANVDMNKLFNTVLSSFDYQLREMNARINQHDVNNCYGDTNQLNQLFSNIISNAIKYRDKNRKLSIDISSEIKYNKVIYKIIDNGIGINKRHMERIWDVFYRVDASESEAGEGLGLSLAKRIVDKHKGKIWAESTEGEGSAFFIELHKNRFEE